MENSSSKRKRKQHSLDEDEVPLNTRKKVKRTHNEIPKESVNRKEQAHSLSSSESECNRKSPSNVISAETSFNGNHYKREQNHLLTSNEDFSGSGKRSKKSKLTKKSAYFTDVKEEPLSNDEDCSKSTLKEFANLTHVKNEFNHQLSSDESYSNGTNVGLTTGNVKKKSGKQFVEIKTEVDELSDLDSQVIETNHFNEDSSLEDKPKLQNNNVGIQIKNKVILKKAGNVLLNLFIVAEVSCNCLTLHIIASGIAFLP